MAGRRLTEPFLPLRARPRSNTPRPRESKFRFHVSSSDWQLLSHPSRLIQTRWRTIRPGLTRRLPKLADKLLRSPRRLRVATMSYHGTAATVSVVPDGSIRPRPELRQRFGARTCHGFENVGTAVRGKVAWIGVFLSRNESPDAFANTS